MATNTTEMTTRHRLIEEALRLQRVEKEPERHPAEPAAVDSPRVNGTGAAADSGPEFALLPLVDKIAYAFASGLIVAMRELEGHIAGETQKVSDSVNAHLGALRTSFQELTESLSEQRSVSAAVQEKCRELEAATAALQQTDERQDVDLNALRSDAAAIREEAGKSAASLCQRMDATAATLAEADANTAAGLSALRAEVQELSTSTSGRVDALAKELMVQQEDLGAIKITLTGFSATVDGFVERLDRQAEALRSMFAAYSQRETQLEQLVDGLTRLRTVAPAPAARL